MKWVLTMKIIHGWVIKFRKDDQRILPTVEMTLK